MRRQYFLISVAIITFSIISCSEDSPTTTDTGYTYEIPALLEDGLTVGSAADAGFNEAELEDMIDFVDATAGQQVHSILIIKDGTLVFEKYFDGFQYDFNSPTLQGAYIRFSHNTRNYLASVTKSVTSILFGIAGDLGYYQSTDELLLDHFPEHDNVLIGEKANITLKHLLTMTCGLAFDEYTYPYGDQRNDVTGLFRENSTWFVLQKDLETTPGTSWHYNSGNANVLADMIRRNYGGDVRDFAEEYLFGPLGITDYRWEMLNQNLIFASGGLHLSSRNMAKLGLLFANDGVWNGEQIVSSEWVEESTQNHSSPGGFGGPGFSVGYGYQWWLNRFTVNTTDYECYFGVGWGEQYIYVFPDIDMVVVIPCGYFSVPNVIAPNDIVENLLLPALEGN
ncbi:serine hydrolase domain-containing protein [Bacteroidota bacterium]